MSDTQEYDELPERDKELIRVGYEVGYDRGWCDRALRDGISPFTPAQEKLFMEAIRKRRALREVIA